MSVTSSSLVFLNGTDQIPGTGVVVSRLDIDAPAGLVKGVQIQPSQGHAKDANFSVKARREVILCAGAICTPQILLLSGIGPKPQGQQSEDNLDIPLVKELPAVGTMFSDHYSFSIMMEIPKKETFHLLESIWGLWHILLWIFLGRGLFAQTTMRSAAYIRTGAIDTETMSVKPREADGTDNLDTSQPTNRPDIEIMVMPINGLERAVPGHALFNLYPTIIQPHATGSVTLVSPNFVFELLPSEANRKFRKAPIPSTTLASSTQCSLMNGTWPLRDWPFDSRCELQLNFRIQGTHIQPRSHLPLATDPTCWSNGSRLLMSGAHRTHHHLLSQHRANS